MASQALADFLKRLRGGCAARGLGERTDEQLLERFVVCQDESAFEAVVQRHGPMVLGVCRHLLADAHDVEDAFQATFLVLVSKAPSIRTRTLLANWLYRVAYRVALRARVNAARRRVRHTQGVEMSAAEPDAEGIEPELRPILYEELNRLPDKYRVPIVLCYLQGKTNEEAARHLAWPVGTVKGRLTRARELLRSRLTRRGLALSAGTLTAVLSPMAAQAVVPSALLESTIRAALLVAAGHAAAGIVSVHAAALSRGVLQTMFRTRLTIACAVLLGVGVIGASARLVTRQKLTEPMVYAEAPPQRPARLAEEKPAPIKQDENAQKVARQGSADNLRQLMRAMHKYHEVNDHFPPAAIYDKDGKALLSWRVLLLPCLEQDDLFKQFHLDEPWNSEHNRALLAKMPKQYAPPLAGKMKEKYTTFYQVFIGKGTIFEGTEGMGFSDITDGTSATVAIVEAAEAVPWTKPADLPYDAEKPLPKLGGLFPNGFHAVLADGSAHWLKKDFDATEMRHAITRNAGDLADFDKLRADK
jgi:RNA polymerase sigma factor (sigma-70 family)